VNRVNSISQVTEKLPFPADAGTQVSMILNNFTNGDIPLTVASPRTRRLLTGGFILPSSFLMFEIGLNSLEHIFSKPLDTANSSAVAQRNQDIQNNIDFFGNALHNLTSSEIFHKASSSQSWDIVVIPMFPLELLPNFAENPNNLTELTREVNLWNKLLNQTLIDLQARNVWGDRIFSWVSTSTSIVSLFQTKVYIVLEC
jgi:hypothetical protein